MAGIRSYGYSDLALVGLGGSGTADVYTAVAHNTVAAGTRLPHQGSPIVRCLESRPEYGFARVDLSPTFGQGAHVERDVLFVRSLETLVIFDRGASVFLAHCETTPTTSGGQATCTNGSQVLGITSLLGSPSTRVVDEGSRSGQQGIEISTSGGEMLRVLQARDASAPPLSPSVVDNGGSYTLKLNSEVSVEFVKGATSSGGAITIDGITTALRPDVQSMT